MNSIRVVLADDHALVRAGIRELLQKIPGVEVVGEAGDGHEALALVKSRHPSLVLLDIAMKGLMGLEVAERISREFPSVKVIILSMHSNAEYVRRALRTRASGYILKDAATVELELAVKAVASGQVYLSPSVSRGIIDKYLDQAEGPPDALGQLTPRQREILQLVAEGRNTKEIAFTLGVSIKTVETHRTQLMGRLGIHDVAGLVRYAIRVGLVAPEL